MSTGLDRANKDIFPFDPISSNGHEQIAALFRVTVVEVVNQRTASVECEGGSGWRVPFAMLSLVMDI